MKYFFVILVCVAVLFYACVPKPKKIDIPDVVVSSYIRTWPLNPRDRQSSLYWNAGMVNAQHLTELNLAFALIDGRDFYSIYIPELRPSGGRNPMFSNIWQEVALLKKKYSNLKVNISIGGWGADHFSDMANESGLRAKFVDGVCDWLKEYDLDGVDIDWEYPVGPSWGQDIKSRREDADNYLSLLQDLRYGMDNLGKKNGKYYSLSTAVPASRWFPAVIDVVAVANTVNALKLMSYDYYGSWNNTTGHLANIFNNPKDRGGWSTDQALNEYLKAGVPPHKIQIGFAFYGRAFKGVSPGPDNDGLYQSYKSIPFGEGEVTWSQITELLQPGSGYKRYWDDVAKSPYIYNGDIWITYCDEQLIMELTSYAREKSLGGFFTWEYAADINADLLKVLADNAQKK
jgi:chitinase